MPQEEAAPLPRGGLEDVTLLKSSLTHVAQAISGVH